MNRTGLLALALLVAPARLPVPGTPGTPGFWYACP